MSTVLSVGAARAQLPARYEGWRVVMLDIDQSVQPDICLDALKMQELPAGEYDAAFSSHMLEHVYQHEVATVLSGMHHILRAGGVLDLIVPDPMSCLRDMFSTNRDINDVCYRTKSGVPIRYHDILFGWNAMMEQGNLFYAHRCAFSGWSLADAIAGAGFVNVTVSSDGMNLMARAEKCL